MTDGRKGGEGSSDLPCVLEHLPIAVALVGPDGRIQDANPAAVALLGRSRARLIGQYPAFLSHPEDQAQVADALQCPPADGAAKREMEHRIIREDGQEVWVSARVAPWPGHASAGVGVLVVLEEIDDRKAFEEEAHRTRRGEIVGQLACPIGHDLNNVFMLIQGNLLLLREQQDAAGVQHASERIQAALERGTRLVRRLMTLGRVAPRNPQLCDVNAVLHTVGEDIQRLFQGRRSLHLVPFPEPCWIRVDPDEIEQVILNLALNARDALPEGGDLQLLVRRVAGEEIAGVAQPPSGPHVLLLARDNGTGMDDEVMKHLFQPYHTTKPRGKGTGLGLSIIHRIVTRAGGILQAESRRGEGTTFRIYLPLQTPPK
jgi:two-component system cell cycle sensor histidine kinase/response regulator CckA